MIRALEFKLGRRLFVDNEGKHPRRIVTYLVEHRVGNTQAIARLVVANTFDTCLEPIMVQQLVKFAGDDRFKQCRGKRIIFRGGNLSQIAFGIELHLDSVGQCQREIAGGIRFVTFHHGMAVAMLLQEFPGIGWYFREVDAP